MREKVAIVHAAIVQCLPWKEICQEHRVTMNVISPLVRKARKNPKFIDEITAKEDLKEAKAAAFTKVVDQLVKSNVFIDNSMLVMDQVNEEF